jgi:hypothetical protein
MYSEDKKKIFNLNNNTKKNIMLFVATIAIIALIIYGIYIHNIKNYNYLKLDSNKNIVYTGYDRTYQKIITKVPYINLNSPLAKSINDDIKENIVDKFMQQDANVVSYKYSISGNVLSLLIMKIDNVTSYYPEYSFITYNIDLKTQKSISDAKILDLFGITSTEVNATLAKTFKKYYSNEVTKEYIPASECDYNCFLGLRNITTNYLENTSYYIANGKLYVYKPFNIYSFYGEEKYFSQDNFAIKISA